MTLYQHRIFKAVLSYDGDIVNVVGKYKNDWLEVADEYKDTDNTSYQNVSEEKQ